MPTSDAGSPDSGSTSEDDDEREDFSTAHSRSTTLASTSTTATKSPATKERAKEVEKGPKAKGDNLIGKINNLVTSDLSNITAGRDFLYLCTSPSYVQYVAIFMMESRDICSSPCCSEHVVPLCYTWLEVRAMLRP